MDRIYTYILKNHFKNYSQMAFLTGPRQVGKTTIAKQLQKDFKDSIYLNWDVISDREQILSGQNFIQDIFPLHILRDQKPLIIFDEIHKYKNWKNYLKGFFDLYKDYYNILVTGSARLDIYQSGGDSLMGRYFQYSVHPLSLREILNPAYESGSNIFNPILQKDEQTLNTLFSFGGFPDPFLKQNKNYLNMWHASRLKQLIFEDIQSLAQIHDIHLIEVLAELLKDSSSQLLNRSSLAKKIKVTTQTISRWLVTLERFYYCFSVSPWHKNITRSLIKEPKLYLWDWSLLKDEGQRFENMLALNLLKFCHLHTEQGLADFKLFYLRDIDKKEVDFLITKDSVPFMMVEAKLSNTHLNPNMYYFQKQLNPSYSLQVVYNLEPIKQSCFKEDDKIYTVPASSFLSQII